MKHPKKSLKALLEGDFKPLEVNKEGKLMGGFATLGNGDCDCGCSSNGDCNCSCPSNGDCDCSCPSNGDCNCSCPSNGDCNCSCGGNKGTTTVAPSTKSMGIGIMGFF